ncbi:MAG TPA: LPS export ABC transporter permease LptG [Beijerinckiaceae bacterium]|nr:LPS export ABC transporter permease LptG [Beijerinckiaceae bacterium]
MLIGPTLGRYLARQFTRTILAVFATVFALVCLLDFVELMRRAGDAEGATPAFMARLAFFRTPAIAEQVFPFAILFGSMVTLLQLSRKLELVVARSAGVSAWQFLQPGILVAALLGILSVLAYNPFSAYLKQQAAEQEARLFARAAKAASEKELWIRQKSVDGQAILRADGAMSRTTTISRVTIFTFDENGVFNERIEAPEAALRDGYWELKDARILSAAEEPQTFDTYILASNLHPSQVRQTFTPPESVPFWDMAETIARTERSGLDATRYRLQHDILLARPLLFVVMVILAASVSLRFFRFGGVAPMVLGGVAAGFMLYVATEVMRDLGSAGLVGPTVAAWFPAVVGSLLGTLALLYQEDG